MTDSVSYQAPPVVSVMIITYNHAPYIAQALESVLAQQTDFAVEIVIGEDCSPDSTRAIAQGYEQRYPGRVRVLAHERNLGIMPNLTATMAACTGEFIAFLEGDDYWTDPTKLQRQVDALRVAQDCAMCFHDAELIYENGTIEGGNGIDSRPLNFSALFSNILSPSGVGGAPIRYSQHDIARLGWFIPSASMVFRKSSLPHPLPAWYAGVFSGDYTLQLLSTSYGQALYLPRQMSAYRQHIGGVMHTMNNSIIQNERRIWENEHYKKVFGHALAPYFEHWLEYLYFERSEKMRASGQRAQQFYYYTKAISVNSNRLWYHLVRLGRRIAMRVVPSFI